MGNQTSNVAESSRPERGHHHHHPGHQHAHGHSHGHPGVAPYQNVPNTHITHPGHTRTGPGQGHSRHPQGGSGGGGGGSVTGGGGHHHHHRPPGSERGSATGGGGHSPLDLNRAVHNQNANINMMQRSPSDTAMPMSIHDDKATTGVVGADGRSKATNNGATTVTVTEGMNIVDLSAAEDDVVPTVFRWEHGGREVYITGTFNEWTRQIPMHRSGNDFTYIHNLRRGKHAFKFIVDDEWRFAPDQPTVADIDGRINNFIDVTDFKPYTGDKSFEQEKNAAYYSKSHHQPPRDASSKSSGGGHGHAGGGGGGGYDHPAGASTVNAMSDDDPMTNDQSMDDPDGEVFTHNMPDMDEYTKDPPPLPPHLRHIILNKPPQLQDTAALPIPQHVALNHLYCTAIRDNMMVLGITQRFRTKFVTTVHYSPELSRT